MTIADAMVIAEKDGGSCGRRFRAAVKRYTCTKIDRGSSGQAGE